MGNAHMDLDQLDPALEYFQKDLEIARKKNSDDSLNRALTNMGRIYVRRGDCSWVCLEW